MRSKRLEGPSIFKGEVKKKKWKRQYQQQPFLSSFSSFSLIFLHFLFLIPCSPTEFCYDCSNAYKSLSFGVHKTNSYCVQSQLNRKKPTQDKPSKQLRIQRDFISAHFFSEKQPYKCCFAVMPSRSLPGNGKWMAYWTA